MTPGQCDVLVEEKDTFSPTNALGLRLTPFNSLFKVRGRKERKHIRVRDRLRWIILTFLFSKGRFWPEVWITPMCNWLFHCEAGCCMNALREDGEITLQDSSRLIRSDQVEDGENQTFTHWVTDVFYIHRWHLTRHVSFNWPFVTIKATMTEEFKGRGHAARNHTKLQQLCVWAFPARSNDLL